MIMHFDRYSHHKFTSLENISFSIGNYSAFKFGSSRIGHQYGLKLFQSFASTLLIDKCNVDQCVLYTSPHMNVPTATFTMMQSFQTHLNRHLMKINRPSCQVNKIYREYSYREDYGNMTSEERTEAMSGDAFYTDVSFMKGKTVIILDDVRISGAHEKKILDMLEKLGAEPSHLIFMYYAEMIGNSDSRVENRLNYAYVKNIDNINTLIKSGWFSLNTRVVKYILNTEHEACKQFFKDQTTDFLIQLYDASIANNYHTDEMYKKNFTYLHNLIRV